MLLDHKEVIWYWEQKILGNFQQELDWEIRNLAVEKDKDSLKRDDYRTNRVLKT